MGLVIEKVLATEEEEYLQQLTTCFPGWGDQARFAWVFHRDSGAGLADMLFARFDGEVVGGTGVSYRRVLHPNGRESQVGIMTGSWVLPAARGKGCFTAMVDAMTQCSSRRQCSLLVAYAFEANPSYRAMARAGLANVETCYLRDPNQYEPREALPPLPELSVGDRSLQMASVGGISGAGQIQYAYSTDAWRDQYLQGEFPIAFLELPGGSLALVEEANGFLRLQALSVSAAKLYPEVISSLLDLAKSRNARLFLFSVDPQLTAAAIAAGCERIPGGYFMRVAGEKSLREWTACSESTPVEESNLIDSAHPAFVGNWQIQNRDRM